MRPAAMGRFVLLAAVLLAGCSGPEETRSTGTGKRLAPEETPPAAGGQRTSGNARLVGVSLSSRNHNFFLGMEQGVDEELQAQGLTAEKVVAEDSATTQQQQVDTLLAKGVGAIVMVPVDAKQAAVAVEAANARNVPVFCIDRRITEGNARVASTIETDNKKMGEAAARHALTLLCDRHGLDPDSAADVRRLRSTVVHLWGLPAASSAQDRAVGFEQVFSSTTTPNVRVIKEVGDFNTATSQRVLAPVLRANPDVELIFCHNDDNAIGALNAIKDIKGRREPANDRRRILIVSIDGNRPAIEAIRAGDLEATVSQEPIRMGRETVKQLKSYLEGGEVPEYVPIPHHLVTRKEAEAKKGELWADQLKGGR